jgi:orotidine-5'-phosphate decarboxylase
MAVDILQEKVRKLKNPSMLELALPMSDLPPQYDQTAAGYGAFCRELLEGLKDTVPAVRVSFALFALLGADGMTELTKTLTAAAELGYYVCLDAPEVSSPAMAKVIADALLGEGSTYPCDGLILSGYAGSDILKPFLPYTKKAQKDLYVITRTANKSAHKGKTF